METTQTFLIKSEFNFPTCFFLESTPLFLCNASVEITAQNSLELLLGTTSRRQAFHILGWSYEQAMKEMTNENKRIFFSSKVKTF